jgi:hypothetical protein
MSNEINKVELSEQELDAVAGGLDVIGADFIAQSNLNAFSQDKKVATQFGAANAQGAFGGNVAATEDIDALSAQNQIIK